MRFRSNGFWAPAPRLVAVVWLAGLWGVIAPRPWAAWAAEALLPRPQLQEALGPVIREYCADCHGSDSPEAGLNLEGLATAESIWRERGRWKEVLARIETGEMPPEDATALPDKQRLEVIDWLRAELSAPDCSGTLDPGRPTLRRLNRVEYQNTVRDLTGVEFDVATHFPSDELGFGFDNNGDVLSLSPLLMEKYLSAARQIAATAWESAEPHVLREFAGEPARDRQWYEDRWADGDAWRAPTSELVRRLLAGALRRPARDGEVQRLLALCDQARHEGDSFAQAMQVVLQQVLASPYFLFRVEGLGATGIHPVNEFELAARLSYFLWSSMPDRQLRELAAADRLRQNLARQVSRLLEDPRGDTWIRHFGEQWLETRKLELLDRERTLFPQFDESLREALREEVFLWLRHFVRSEAPLTTLLTGEYTFVNPRLATHYGWEEGTSQEGPDEAAASFRRVPVPPQRQCGVLGLGGVLAVTSHRDRTSPVLRGKWVLERLLNDPPPPPPPDVPALEPADPAAEAPASLRERLALHVADPGCASCHERLDPLGFALENFDPLGRWREDDGHRPVDATATLPDGREFAGPIGLREVLLVDFDRVRRALAEQLLTYALGRGLEYEDQCAVDEVVAATIEGGDTMAAMIRAVIHSYPFQYRNEETP
jgi:mono/diheme cytochrome c family protein